MISILMTNPLRSIRDRVCLPRYIMNVEISGILDRRMQMYTSTMIMAAAFTAKGGTDHPPLSPKEASLNPVPGGNRYVRTAVMSTQMPMPSRTYLFLHPPLNSALSTSLYCPAKAPRSMNMTAIGSSWQWKGRLYGKYWTRSVCMVTNIMHVTSSLFQLHIMRSATR